MSIPALRLLRRCFPAANIALVCQDNLRDIFDNISEIDQILTIVKTGGWKGFYRKANQLRRLDADIGILFTNSFHSALLFKASGVKTTAGYQKDLRGMLLSHTSVFPRAPYHQIDFYLDLIRDFVREYSGKNIQMDSRIPVELNISEQEISKIEKRLSGYGIKPGMGIVGISPSTAYGSSKEWLPDRFVELINRLGVSLPKTHFAFFGSGAEQEKIESICRQCPGNVTNLAGKLSLKQSIAAISRCRYFISNDSGLMHVASALKIPLVAIFGPTDPGLTAPRSGIVARVHHPVECAPCKYRKCPIDHRCMTGIQVGDVYNAIMEMHSDRQEKGS